MSWPKVRLGGVGTLIRGKGIKRSETCATGKPCIRYGEIYTSFNVLLDKPRSFVDDALFDDCPHIKKGDLVLTLTGENKEEIAKTLCYLGDEEIAAGGDLAIWSGHGCDPKFLAYLMYSPAMIKAKADASNGHIVVHASVKKLQDIELPLPPLAEQKKIVEKVEKALKRVDALKAQFERMEKSAADYFKAALAETFAAVKGEKVKLGDVCESISVRGHQIKQSEIGQYGAYPVISQSENEIEGYTDQAILVKDVPLVLFGDHTCVVKKIDFPFVVGADGTKLLKPLKHDVSYFYYYCTWAASKLMDGKYRRHYSDMAECMMPKIDMADQISAVQRLDAAKSKSERMVAAARRGIEICGKMRKAILAEAFQ